MKILVTGASGFVGRALCGTLVEAGHDITPAVRVARGILNVHVIGDSSLALRAHPTDEASTIEFQQGQRPSLNQSLNA